MESEKPEFKSPCPDCEGAGGRSFLVCGDPECGCTDWERCEMCNGTGEVP